MFLIIFPLWIIKVAHCKKLNLAEDKSSDKKVYVLGQDYSIGNKKNFLAR